MAKKPSKAKVKAATKRSAKAKTKRATKAAGNGGDGRKLSKHDNGTAARLSADEERALFLHHRSAWNNYQAKLKAIEKIGTEVKAALKADGLLVLHMQIADDLAGSPKREQKVRAAVTERLRVARWIGHPMGAQMDLFEHPPAAAVTADRAFDDGKRTGMEGGKCDPPEHFSAGDLQQSWTSGWHEGQQAMVRKGIKPTDEPGDPEGERPAAGFGPSHLPLAAQEDGGL